jgi:hypothetical protein
MAEDVQNRECRDGSSRDGHPKMGRVPVQRKMSTDLVLIRGIGPQDTARVHLAEDDQMIEALAPARDQVSVPTAIGRV